MSKISYFIVRTFDVKHHAAHGTILINFGPEKRSYSPPHRVLEDLGGPHTPRQEVHPPPNGKSWIRA